MLSEASWNKITESAGCKDVGLNCAMWSFAYKIWCVPCYYGSLSSYMHLKRFSDDGGAKNNHEHRVMMQDYFQASKPSISNVSMAHYRLALSGGHWEMWNMSDVLDKNDLYLYASTQFDRSNYPSYTPAHGDRREGQKKWKAKKATYADADRFPRVYIIKKKEGNKFYARINPRTGTLVDTADVEKELGITYEELARRHAAILKRDEYAMEKLRS